MLTHVPRFYSQQGEDEHLLHTFFKGKTEGMFIELGALDGVLYSNTKFYEDTLGWKGILIEPVPRLFEMLQNNRSRCEVHQLAICDQQGEVEFIGEDAYAGSVHTYGKELMEARKMESKLSSQTYPVQAKPFHEIVDHKRIPKVDLLSVDVEGGEYEVLNTFDWDIDVSVVIYESSLKWKQEDLDRCQELMKEKGYTFHERFHGSEIWYREDLITPL